MPWIVYVVIFWACLAMGVVALVDAIRRRPDSYPAADKQTKQFWLIVLGAGLLAQWLFPALGSALGILGLAGIVASIVYLVGVRPKLIEVSRGPRW